MEHAAVGALTAGGETAVEGERTRVFHWASVTKLLTAYAALVAAEEGTIDLDEAVGPPGSTVRHLLAHASGLPFLAGQPTGRVGTKRMYSNPGIELAAELVASHAQMPFERYLAEAVLEPLEMGAELRGSPAAGLHGSLDDLVRFAGELLEPRLIAPETLAEATSVQFPGLAGVIPDVGRFDPNDWGLGFELQGRQGAALVGHAHVAEDVRPLRRLGHVPLGRPRGCGRALLSHRPRVRRMGARGVAGAVRRRARRGARNGRLRDSH